MAAATQQRKNRARTIAMVRAPRGDGARAFAWLETARADRLDEAIRNIKLDLSFNGLKSDPRYAAPLRELRLS